MTPTEPPVTAAVEVEVRYVETDQMGVVHHANYVVWFELARTHLCALAGFEYAEIERQGFLLMVTGVAVRYRRGARYGETVTVTARVDRAWSRGVRYAYEVRRGETLLATGTTDHVWVNRESRRPTRPPADLAAAMRRLAGEERAAPADSATS